MSPGESGQTNPSYRTVPGVDRSGDRKAAKLAYLSASGDPHESLLTLASSLKDAQDTPSSKVKIKAPKATKSPSAKASGVGGPLFELFYKNTSIKNGKPAAPVSGHDNHVHVAAGPKSVDNLGRLAQSMGLSVRENETFDPVDPVHTKNSYHYRNRAVDVSGDPKKLKRYVKRVRKLYGS